MDDSFVRAVQNALVKPVIETVAGEERLLVPEHWAEIKRTIPDVKTLTVNTLMGFAHYVTANVDMLKLPELMVHVLNPSTVRLVAKLEGETATYFRRHTYLEATTGMVASTTFPFGQFQDVESFIILLQTQFVESDIRAALLLFTAGIRDSNVREVTDDSYAQAVNVAEGIKFVGSKNVPNPVVLAPYRTFREVEQPTSPFVLRLRPGPKDVPNERPRIGLFEADGGAWKLEAIERIAAFLKEELPDGVAVLA